MANRRHLGILQKGVDVWNKWRQEHPRIKPDLRNADLNGAVLHGANFSNADLSYADISETHINYGNFNGAILTGAEISGANLMHSSFLRANLSNVSLSAADLFAADLSDADLTGADLSGASLLRTNLSRSVLTGCSIYGISVWGIQLEGAKQDNLTITPEDEPTITVDNLKVAQFIYLLLNNAEIREVIDTIAKKAVLILGRFTPQRKATLAALREALHTHGYLPILFDFDKPSSQDFTETVSTLAHLSRFIVADLTDPSSIPQELYAIVPHRMVPVQPLLKESEDPKHPSREYSMFIDLRKKYHWVLSTHRYRDLEDLLASLQAKVIDPAEQKARELENR